MAVIGLRGCAERDESSAGLGFVPLAFRWGTRREDIVMTKVVILAGGRGTRLSEETHAVPKPMVSVGGRPIIWHIMRHYARYGFRDFIVACGYKGEVLKQYFANYPIHESDLAVDLSRGSVQVLSQPDVDWRITLVDTGQETMTGGRLKRLAPHLGETFMLTYGDGLSDVPLDQVLRQHRAQEALATVTAVRPLPRWGALSIAEGKVTGFAEKPSDPRDWINGGFFVVEPDVLDLLPDDACYFEREPLQHLATHGLLGAYQHEGFWMAMDTARDRDELNALWEAGDAPWAPSQ